MSIMQRKAVFLDRDGVINRERGHLHRLQDFEFLPGAVAALQRLQRLGFALTVVTNQSGIARGLFSLADYLALNEFMLAQLAGHGVALAGIEYCPHLSDARVEAYRRRCDCRKPAPGMVLALAERLRLDLRASVLIGDKPSDVQAGRSAGVGRCWLVRSGHALRSDDLPTADAVFDDLAACATALADEADEGARHEQV